mmetsp:Transcript_46079/g.73615  ORF Transcript_46079/g.73615 Transcript_46079/m.73615 type:complete len:261 (+) Transcript_46079:1011-1793(+)
MSKFVTAWKTPVGSICMASAASALSHHSILTAPVESGGHCFLLRHWFLTPEKKLVQAKNLIRGSRLLASSGDTIEVKLVEFQHGQEQKVVEVLAGIGEEALATLKVTCSHRVMVRRGGQIQPLQAGALKKGDFVCCSGSQFKELVSVKTWSETVDIADITFSPDFLVEAFNDPPPTILSKGSAQAKTRRGKNRPSATSRQGRLTYSALSRLNHQFDSSGDQSMNQAQEYPFIGTIVGQGYQSDESTRSPSLHDSWKTGSD